MPTTDQTSAEDDIRKLDVDWGKAASRKDLEGVVAFYASDASVVWPGAPAAHGTADIRAAWSELMKTPGLSLEFIPERIQIAASGDMAIDFGVVKFGHDTNAWAHLLETAKYVVVWKKIKGTWKVMYDCYNMNT